MNVTIIADASHCPDTGAAGYGFWIASGRGKLGGQGPMKNPVVNNIAAEMMALLNAFHAACSKGYIQKGDLVLMQTDCQAAIDTFLKFRTTLSTQEQSLVNTFYDYEERAGVVCEFRHVPGHTNGETPRQHVNNMCDQQARHHMRKARTKLKRS